MKQKNLFRTLLLSASLSTGLPRTLYSEDQTPKIIHLDSTDELVQRQPAPHDHSKNFYETTYFKENISQLETELKEHPTAPGYGRLSDLFFQPINLEKFKKAAEKALEIDPTYWEGLFNLSTYYAEKGNSTNASRYLEEAEKRGANPIIVLNQKGRFKLWKDDFYGALDEFNRVLLIQPKNEPALEGRKVAISWIEYLRKH